MELNESSIDDRSEITVQSSTTIPTPTKTPWVAVLRYESTNLRAAVMPWPWEGKNWYSCFCSRSCSPNPRPMATSSANAGTIESTVE